MSCETRPNRIAAAGVALGIARLAGKSGFYLGLTAATIGLTGAMFLARGRAGAALRRMQAGLRQRLSDPSRNSGRPARLAGLPPILRGRPTVAPTLVDELRGKRCGQCRARPKRKPGPWYVVAGQAYCQDCAQGAAQEAGVDLAVAPQPVSLRAAAPLPTIPANRAKADRVAINQGSFDRPRPGAGVEQTGAEPGLFALDRRLETRLKEAELAVTLVMPAPEGSDGEASLARYPVQEAYLVLTGDGRPTGLGLTPMVEQVRDTDDRPQLDQKGRPVLRTNDQGWNVVHCDSGFVLAGPFLEPGQARDFASLIAQRDWTRPLAEIEATESIAVQELARQVIAGQLDLRHRREAQLGKFTAIPAGQAQPGDVYKFIPPSGQGPVFADVLEVYPERGQVVIQLWDRERTRLLAYMHPPQGQVVFGRRLEREEGPR